MYGPLRVEVIAAPYRAVVIHFQKPLDGSWKADGLRSPLLTELETKGFRPLAVRGEQPRHSLLNRRD